MPVAATTIALFWMVSDGRWPRIVAVGWTMRSIVDCWLHRGQQFVDPVPRSHAACLSVPMTFSVAHGADLLPY